VSALLPEEIAELEAHLGRAEVFEDGGKQYVYLPEFQLPHGCSPERVDVLLCPTERDGYPSRLFFAEKVECSKPLNWNASRVRIASRNWWAFSWKLKQPPGRLLQIVAAHLSGFAK